jgi:hypothetical protein
MDHDNHEKAAPTSPHAGPRVTDSVLPPSEITVDSIIESALAITVMGTTNLTNVLQLQVKLFDTVADQFVTANVRSASLNSGNYSIAINPPANPSTYVIKVYYASTTDPAGDVSPPFDWFGDGFFAEQLQLAKARFSERRGVYDSPPAR